MSLPFLLEIGVEEIPDWMIVPALKNLQELFEGSLAEHKLGGSVTAAHATPRRLVLWGEGLLERQPDEVKPTLGPPVTSGQGAAQGFAKKMGVPFDQLEVVSSAKGEYYSFNKPIAGRSASDILAEVIPAIIGKIYFPKTMYWTGKGGARFIRPIRWIVALLGEHVIPFEFAQVKSGRITSGHRRLGSSSIEVTVAGFESKLRDNFVILAADERRQAIEQGLADDVRKDDALIETLVYLTEYPTPIRGSFDKQFLRLPQEILSTVMRHHQRYFSVQDAHGDLAPQFVAVMNTDADPDGLVRTGNERVLRARFNDARFFWEVDLRRTLLERVNDLGNVTFQAKLGTYLEKAQRIATLAKELAILTGAEARLAQTAALLCKCDLTTEMVKEFTELQGVVGGLYAREQGEPDDVWQAIYDHYQPVSMEDSIPRNLAGQVVALADKLDTLRSCFSIGMMPTGSKDPFALRRSAQGVIKIIVEGKLKLSLATLSAGDKTLEEFLLDRARYYFKDIRGFKYDEVNAVFASGADDLVDAESRLIAIGRVRNTEDFEPLAASFKRIQNILLQAELECGGKLDTAMLEGGPEADLYAEFTRIRGTVDSKRGQRDYAGALETIASLRPKVDHFFDKVLVNAPDPLVRRNRLTMLQDLLTEFSAIADFSEIVTQH
jgi:glycyl-tRNA synthetase beta chain